MAFDDFLPVREIETRGQLRHAHLQDQVEMGEGMTHLCAKILPVGLKGRRLGGGF